MSKRLKILFVPLDGHGHINFCHGIADVLRNRRHRIIFAIDYTFKGRLVKYGFEEEIIELKKGKSDDQESTDEFWPEFVKKNSVAFKSTDLIAPVKFMMKGFPVQHLRNKELDESYQNIIDKIKPNIIMIDMYCGSPTLTNSGIPWVYLFSAAQHLIMNSNQIPPYWSGLPLNDKTKWNEFIQKRDQMTVELRNDINQFYISKGLPELQKNRYHPESPFMNIYLFPKELDYTEIITLPNNYIRIDAAIRSTNEQFSIPKKLESKPGKLVFLSMGSFGSADMELMTRLVSILSKSPNRFIVSKGAHNRYELADNMWGQRMVPQTKVIPLVDLVIHHGGNNTLTETLYFGKPMIVMPLFGDQYDNAQCVVEIGCGLKLNPYYCSEQDFLESIEQLLNNEQLEENMRIIGQRIRNSDSLERASDIIENIVN